MSEIFLKNDTRQTELAERALAESILGYSHSVRIYSKIGNIGRGTVTLSKKDGYSVHTAYVIGMDEVENPEITGKAVGVLIDRKAGSTAVVLCGKGYDKNIWYQHEIAEAIENCEIGDSVRIYCLHEKSCGAVVFSGDGDDRRYIIIRMNSGHYGLPKGHVEKYEDEIAAARREVSEEIGIAIEILPDFRIPVEYYIAPRTHKESIYFLGRFDGGKVIIQKSEISSYRICSYEEARQLITYENDRAVIDAAERFLNGK